MSGRHPVYEFSSDHSADGIWASPKRSLRSQIDATISGFEALVGVAAFWAVGRLVRWVRR